MLSGKLEKAQRADAAEVVSGFVGIAAILMLQNVDKATFDDDCVANVRRITEMMDGDGPDTWDGYREWVVEICENTLKLLKPMMVIPPKGEDEGHSDLSSPDSELRARGDALNDERVEKGE